MAKYRNSVYEMVKSLFGDHEWKEMLFVHKRVGYWDEMTNQREFMDHVGRELKVMGMEGPQLQKIKQL